MGGPTMETLERRLEGVERENRRLKRAGALALVLIVAMVLMGHVLDEKVVEAERFVLLDPNGETRAVLVVTNGGAGLYLYDNKGKLRTGLVGGMEDETGLSLYGSDGKESARLNVYADGRPSMTLLGKEAKPKATLTVLSDDSSHLFISDKDGRVIWSVP